MAMITENGNFIIQTEELRQKATFNMGKREGKWKYFYDNGNLKQVSNYKDGLREGIWFRLDIKGDTIWVEKNIKMMSLF